MGWTCNLNCSLKYISLVTLTIHSTVTTLLLHHARTRESEVFFSTTAVTLNEICKTTTSAIIATYQAYHLKNWASCFVWMEWVKMLFPAVIYAIQNNIFYIAISNLDAALIQILMQFRILVTGIFSVVLLGKRINRYQWMSLVLLLMGVNMVLVGKNSNSFIWEGAYNKKMYIGITAVLAITILSSIAGVYFEKVLKENKQSLWLRNVQLGLFGSITSAFSMFVYDGQKIMEKGYFYKYDWLVWLIIFLQTSGGLLVGIVVKYADNMYKCFSTTGAIVISCLISISLLKMTMSLLFGVGTCLVILATFLYTIAEDTIKPHKQEEQENDLV